MDELFGDNVIICNVPTDEILESLPICERELVSLFMQILRKKYNTESFNNLSEYVSKCMNKYKKDIQYYTCFSMALNLLSWQGYDEKNQKKIDTFAELYYLLYDNLEKYFTDDKDFQYWYKIMD